MSSSTDGQTAGVPKAGLLGTPERRIVVAILLFLCLLYIPFAGNYGLWDPWETHYSEVARQMVMRHDYISLWWPGSPQDRNEFWSKPVLTFWLMALSMGVTGLQHAGHAFDGEMAVGWKAEWTVRIPFILCALATIWAVWELTRRLAGRRAALWAAIVLGTATHFFLIARQAMTDMAFVAPMTVAVAMLGLALLLPDEEVGAELQRRSLDTGPPWLRRLSWPHAPVFYGLLAMVGLFIVPQLIVISWQLKMAFITPRFAGIGPKAWRVAGIVPMLPYIAATLGFLYLAARATCRRQIYLYIAFLMCGLATLAKGPAGLGLPGLVAILYLVVTGDFRRMLALPEPGSEEARRAAGKPRWKRVLGGTWRFIARHPLELGAGLLVFIAVTFPWYHAMLIRHGRGFWNEFIGDNYVHRAEGRNGDRGTFEYYLQQLGIGFFPWTGLVAAAALSALARLAGTSKRDRLRSFAVVWTLVMFAVVTLVNTKFHHYILPALPAIAVIAGLFIDDLVETPRVRDAVAVLLVGLPFLGLSARDLAAFPPRIEWLFDYDYVNAPNGGRPWPSGPEYHGKYVYGGDIAAFLAAALLATLIFGAISLVRARRRAAGRLEAPAADVQAPSRGMLAALLVLVVGTVAAAEIWEPPFGDGLPHPLANGWILVAAASAVGLLLLLLPGLRDRASRAVTVGLLAVGVMGCAWTGWTLDRFITDISPHWSQKHVIAAYYRLRKGPEEPLIAWQMYWRGETFYTKNAIYDHRLPQEDKTVFLGDRNAEKMQHYFATHGGRRVFFVVERVRFEALRALLPPAARPTLHPVDTSDNKLYLAVAQLPPSTSGGKPAASK